MMTLKFVLLLFVEFLHLQFNDAFPALNRNDQLCGSKPADVIFALDSSGSISLPDFKRQIKFVIDVIAQFPIGRDSNRIGVISFSNWAQPEFQLKDFDDRNQIYDALRAMVQMKGDTNTASALAHIRDVMLTPQNGARPEVPHIIVVLTDGRSNDPRQTALEAEMIKRRSDVHLFAIGMGDEIDYQELATMASKPTDQYVFTVENYAALETIKELLARKTCQVTNPPISATPAPEPLVQVDQACGSGGAADILLAGSPLANDSSTRKTMQFFKDVVSELDIGPDRVNIGLVPKECDPIPPISLRNFEKKTLRQLRKRSIPSIASVLSYINDVGFGRGRVHVKRKALLVIDGSMDESAVAEAIRAKEEMNVELFVVAVGKDVLTEQVAAVASSSDHIFHVSDYGELAFIVDKIASNICPASYL